MESNELTVGKLNKAIAAKIGCGTNIIYSGDLVSNLCKKNPNSYLSIINDQVTALRNLQYFGKSPNPDGFIYLVGESFKNNEFCKTVAVCKIGGSETYPANTDNLYVLDVKDKSKETAAVVKDIDWISARTLMRGADYQNRRTRSK